jgi:hypothetical protein
MKLELKHLSPYLPHKLEGVFTIYDSIHTVTSLSLIYVNRELEYRHFKPILRPISTITNEDTVFILDLDSVTLELIDLDEWTLDLIKDLQNGEKHQLEQFNRVFERHFDVYNLIPNGLAIDINTLDK